MKLHQVKNRLSAQLLKKVFVYYLVISASLTVMQMLVSYNNTKLDIEQELLSFEHTFAPSISKALWELSDKQLEKILSGMEKLPSIVAVQVADEFGDVNYRSGKKLGKGLSADIFYQKINLSFQNQNIGDLIVYSSTDVVFHKVQTSFIILIINSILKTTALWILVLWISASLISKPLSRLQIELENIDLGKLDDKEIDLNLTLKNEFSFIENSFNKMKKNLYNSYNEEKLLQKKLLSSEVALNKLNSQLEEKVNQRTLELTNEKHFAHSVMNSQSSIVITSDAEEVKTVNNAFEAFFGISGSTLKCLDKLRDGESKKSIQELKKCVESQPWLDDVFYNSDAIHKITLRKNTFTVTIDKFEFNGNELYTIVLNDITELERAKNKIENINKHTKESIEYSTHIQNLIIPSKRKFKEFFADYFLIWQPKDSVGGDIYTFDTVRKGDECIIMLIDCVGHGVPGALVSMLVKAISNQIINGINHSTEKISTAQVLQEFNAQLHSVLLNGNSKSEVDIGFDGGVLYFNRATKLVRYSGARVNLYSSQADEIICYSGDRKSIGDSRCDSQFEFKQSEFFAEEGDKLYFSSDGFIDQLGWDSGFSFGRKNYLRLIEANNEKPLLEQKEAFLSAHKNYQGSEERNDDITLIGLKI